MPSSCLALALGFVFSSFARADGDTTDDGGAPTDTGETVGDTGRTEEDTGTTGGDSGDTGDGGGTDGGSDTGFVGGGVTVSEKAGEAGGFGCEQAALALGLPLGLLGLSRRRRWGCFSPRCAASSPGPGS